jgi:hypothetical protein
VVAFAAGVLFCAQAWVGPARAEETVGGGDDSAPAAVETLPDDSADSLEPAADDSEADAQEQADPTEPTPDDAATVDPEIEALVKQLGDPAVEAREEASQRLKEIGEPALPALKKAMETGDPEVCTRADALIRRLDRPGIPAARPDEAGGGVSRSRSVSVSVVNGVRTRTVEVSEDGRTVRVTEGPDGIELAVTGVDEDGEEVTSEFKAGDAAELKENHPDAFELYERYAGEGADGDNVHIRRLRGRGGDIRIIVPNPADLRGDAGGIGGIGGVGGLHDILRPHEDLAQRDEDLLRALRRGGRPPLDPPGLVRPPGDDLRDLRERVMRQVEEAKLTAGQHERVREQLDRLMEAQARAAVPLIDPFVPPPDPRQMIEDYNRMCDELRRQMDALKLPDPGDALPPPANVRLGISAAEGDDDAEGVTVRQVLPGSRGEKIGLREGDVIRQVNGKAVGDVRELRRAVTDADGALKVAGSRDGQPLVLEEKAPEAGE